MFDARPPHSLTQHQRDGIIMPGLFLLVSVDSHLNAHQLQFAPFAHRVGALPLRTLYPLLQY